MLESVLSTDLEITDEVETSNTYKIHANRIQGYAEKLEALQQAIYKVLNTEKYEYSIYSFDFGIELESLIGQDAAYVKIEMKRRIEDCLLQDENFCCNVSKDEILCTFNVVSIYGEISITKEVNA